MLLGTLFVARADHGHIETRLAGTTLCIGARSVSAVVSGPEGEVQTAPLVRELLERLEATLEQAGVRYEVLESCVTPTVLLSVEARYLDPESYVGFPDNAYTYVVTAQVGTLAGALSEEVEGTRYGATTSDIVSVSDRDAQLLGVAHPIMTDLAQAWRQDNIVPLAQFLIFAGLASLLAMMRVALRLVL